jgi:hypothetical protein
MNRRGWSQWEPIKILLEGDRGSNKMNTTSNTRLRLNYSSWSRPRSRWSATDPRNQQTTFQAKTHLHAQRKLARLAGCVTPVRPMARAGQTSGQIRNQHKTTQRHTDSATHLRQIPQRVHTGQTGQEHRSDRCNLGSLG